MSFKVTQSSAGRLAAHTKENLGLLESFSYDDQIARMFALATLVWGLVAFLVGLTVAVILVRPSWTFGLPYFTFGRLASAAYQCRRFLPLRETQFSRRFIIPRRDSARRGCGATA